MSLPICKHFRNYSSCEGFTYHRDGITLCGAHYRAQYSVSDANNSTDSTNFRLLIAN